VQAALVNDSSAYASSYNAQQLLYSVQGLSNRCQVLKVVMTGGSYSQQDEHAASLRS
jgi:hypothetical protein